MIGGHYFAWKGAISEVGFFHDKGMNINKLLCNLFCKATEVEMQKFCYTF